MRRSNLFALVIFLAVLSGVFFLNPVVTQKLQAAIHKFFYPAVRASASLDAKLAANKPVEDPQKLVEENRDLTRRIAVLENVERNNQQLSDENNEFRKLLGYKQQSKLKLLSARVVKRNNANWWQTLIIDKGTADGIRREMPVVNVDGLIGKTAECWEHESRVILLNDEACRVAAMVDGTKITGIVQGSRGGLNVQSDLRMRYLPKNLQLSPGSTVKSIGVNGGVFPAGIILGHITLYTEQDLGAEATVEPAVHFDDLNDVLVVIQNTEDDKP